MGSNPAQKIPQHRREIRLNVLFDYAESSDIRLLQCCPDPTWEQTSQHFRISFIFSPVVKFMAFMREKMSLEASFRSSISR